MSQRRAATLVLAAAAVVASAAPAGAGTRPVLSTRAGEFQPARGAEHLAWERNTARRPHHFDVFVRARKGHKVRVNPRGTMAANGGIDGRTLAYQQWKGGDSDIRFYDLRKRRRRLPPRGVNTRHWEYWPSVSGRWLLFGRRKPGGARRIVLFDLDTGRSRTLARTGSGRAFAAPGQVNGRWVVWWKCTPSSGCNVYRYDIRHRRRVMVPNPGRLHRAASVAAEGTVYFTRSGHRCGAPVRLMRYFPGAPPHQVVELPRGRTVSDTYVFSGRRGPSRVLYERERCGRQASSDIWSLTEPRFHGLRVTKKAAGGGTVTTTPKGVVCGSDCLHAYRAGKTVTLVAQPEANSNFTGWGGACSGAAPTCTVEMRRARRVVAFFDPASSFTLSVTKKGGGKGRVTSRPQGIDCGRDCWHSYRAGTQVTLTAAARPGSAFAGWQGACTGAGTCRVTVDRVRSVTATFRLVPASVGSLPCCLGGPGAGPGSSREARV
jgi:hypothetical protein